MMIKIYYEIYNEYGGLEALLKDLDFFKENDPACKYYSTPILFYKGYQGLATHRVLIVYGKMKTYTMALFF